MRRLVLVRHAQVRLDPRTPPPLWEITTQGRADAAQLARLDPFDGVGAVITSPEPKARATAVPIAEAVGVELLVEDDRREAERDAPSVDDRAGFVTRVDAWLGGNPVPGWEERDVAAARIVACVTRLLDERLGDLVLVSHGTILSLYFAWLRGVERVDMAEWEAISLCRPSRSSTRPPGRSSSRGGERSVRRHEVTFGRELLRGSRVVAVGPPSRAP